MLGVPLDGLDCRKQLARAGLMAYSRGKTTILDRQGLENVACEWYRAIADECKKITSIVSYRTDGSGQLCREWRSAGRASMPARIVVVHDDPVFTDALVEKLGSNVAWFTDPVRALMALEAARTAAFLITRMQFTDSQPSGLSLARLARASRPNIRILLTGLPRYRDYVCDLGEFIAEPVNATHVGMVIEWLSRPEEEPGYGNR